MSRANILKGILGVTAGAGALAATQNDAEAAPIKEILKPVLPYIKSRKAKAEMIEALLNLPKEDRSVVKQVISEWKHPKGASATLSSTLDKEGKVIEADLKYFLSRFSRYRDIADDIPKNKTTNYKITYKGKTVPVTPEYIDNYLTTIPAHEIAHATARRLKLPKELNPEPSRIQEVRDILETQALQNTSEGLHEVYASLISNPAAKRIFPKEIQEWGKSIRKEAGGRNIDIVNPKAPPKQTSFLNKLLKGGTVGAAGVATGSALTEDAEAFPITGILKGAKAVNAAKRPLSSTAGKMIGRTLEGEMVKGLKMEGKTILNVTKGKGDLRNVNFDDGTSLVMTKDILHDIMRELGSREYLNYKLINKRGANRLMQAEKSLQFHFSRLNKKKAPTQRKKLEQSLKQYFEPTEVPHVTVHYKGKVLSMPQEYAEILEKAGRVVIERGGK